MRRTEKQLELSPEVTIKVLDLLDRSLNASNAHISSDENCLSIQTIFAALDMSILESARKDQKLLNASPVSCMIYNCAITSKAKVRSKAQPRAYIRCLVCGSTSTSPHTSCANILPTLGKPFASQ